MIIARKSGLLTGFSSVALADILANGVAVIVIMIVVTLMVRYEQEQEKLEQAEDVSVLLSREIANSLVMNALPTSPPAVLHDYTASSFDQNPDHAVMPIIELHDKFVREYYTGTTYFREELLRQDNAFDRYIASLAPEQLLALRVDVYGIAQFYIAMSILKHHNHRPRHWHFLAGGGSGQGSGPMFSHSKNLEQNGDDTTGQNSDGRALGDGLSGTNALPEDVSLAGTGAVYGGNSPFQGGVGIDGQNIRGQDIGLPSSGRMQGGADGSPGARGLNYGGSKGQRKGRTQMLFRTAVHPSGKTVELAGEMRGIGMLAVVRAYLLFMKSVQEDADKNLPSQLVNFNFQRHILAPAKNLPPADETAPLFSLFQDLAYWLSSPMFYEDDSLYMQPKTDTGIQGQAIVLPVNTPLKEIQWLRDPDQAELKDNAGNNEEDDAENNTGNNTENDAEYVSISMRIGVHPEIYQGIRVDISQDSILMMPVPEAVPDPDYRWRVITAISPEIDDFVTGFVYAAINQEGQLLLPVDNNAIDMNGLRLTSHVQKTAFLGELWQIFFYSMIAVFFAIGIVRRYRRAT